MRWQLRMAIIVAIIIGLLIWYAFTAPPATFEFTTAKPGYYSCSSNGLDPTGVNLKISLEFKAIKQSTPNFHTIFSYGSYVSGTPQQDVTAFIDFAGRVNVNGHGESFVSSINVYDDKWHSLVFTSSSTEWTLSIDEEVLKIMPPLKHVSIAPQIYIGGAPTVSAETSFYGSIRNVQLGTVWQTLSTCQFVSK